MQAWRGSMYVFQKFGLSGKVRILIVFYHYFHLLVLIPFQLNRQSSHQKRQLSRLNRQLCHWLLTRDQLYLFMIILINFQEWAADWWRKFVRWMIDALILSALTNGGSGGICSSSCLTFLWVHGSRHCQWGLWSYIRRLAGLFLLRYINNNQQVCNTH